MACGSRCLICCTARSASKAATNSVRALQLASAVTGCVSRPNEVRPTSSTRCTNTEPIFTPVTPKRSAKASPCPSGSYTATGPAARKAASRLRALSAILGWVSALKRAFPPVTLLKVAMLRLMAGTWRLGGKDLYKLRQILHSYPRLSTAGIMQGNRLEQSSARLNIHMPSLRSRNVDTRLLHAPLDLDHRLFHIGIRRMCPRLQRAGEGTRIVFTLEHRMKLAKFAGAAFEIDHVHRLAGGAGLGHHRHRIARDDDVIRETQIGEIGILAVAFPQQGGRVLQALLDRGGHFFSAAARGAHEQPHLLCARELREAIADVACSVCVESITAIPAAAPSLDLLLVDLGAATTRDQDIGPGRRQRIAARTERTERREPELQREIAPRRTRAHALDGERQAQRLGEAEALIGNADLDVDNDPAGRRHAISRIE